MPRFSPYVMTCAAGIMLSAPACAEVALISSTPRDGAVVVAPVKIVFGFSQTLARDGTGAEIQMTGMPGMAHHAPMKVTGFKSTLDDKMLSIDLPRALPAGTYSVAWHAMTADAGRAEGVIGFTVK